MAPRAINTLLDLPVLKPFEILLFTHRGFGKFGSIPENTWRAFQESTRLGFEAHELDVRASKDGVPVVFHGPRLERTTSGEGRLEKKTLKELDQLDWGYYLKQPQPTKLLTLKNYFQQIPRTAITNVEIKRNIFQWGFLTERSVLETIRQSNRTKKVIVSGFHLITLLYFRFCAPEIARGVLVDKKKYLPFWLPILIYLCKPDSVHLPVKWCSPKRVQKLQKRGFAILPWVVNLPEDLEKLSTLGVFFAITDKIEFGGRFRGKAFAKHLAGK